MFRLVIFDWSGTLSDDLESCYACGMEEIKEFGGEPVTLEEYREGFFLPFTEWLKARGIDRGAKECYEWWGEHYPKYAGNIRLFPGAKQVLEKLKANGTKIAILSSHIESEIHWLLKENQIGEHFCRVKGSAANKTEEIRGMLEELGFGGADVLFVGDMVHDIDTARHAGIKVAAVSYGYTVRHKLEESGPDYLFDSLEEFSQLF